jgi:hypothetical protein
MVTFIDGPAAGQNLMLRNGPFFLRVTRAGSKFDALDQPGDHPMRDEEVFAYVIAEPPSRCHIRASGGRGGFYAIATYKLVNPQPDRLDLFTNHNWGEWCEENSARFGYEEMKAAMDGRAA